MKTTVITFLLTIFFIQPSLSQSNCSQYYALEEGATFQYTNYNNRGKTEGTVGYQVIKVSTDGETTKASMSINLKDNRGKDIYETEYSFICNGSTVKIDFESLMPKQMIQQMGQNAEVTVDGTDIELPNNLSVGQKLADANVNVAMDMGVMKMNFNVNTVNRKVEKKEAITTPAGTFDCYVIYSENVTKMPMGGNKTFPSRLWLTEGIGMVKQNTYDKRGRVTASSVLTSFTKK